MRAEARGCPRSVLGLLEEDAQRLAQPRRGGGLLGEPPERRRDEVAGALLVLGDECRDLELVMRGDLSACHLCRLLAHMDARGYDVVAPELDDPALERLPYFDLQAGYIQRGASAFPRRGSRGPWTVVEMSYAEDVARLREGPVEDPALRFRTAARELAPAA